MDFLKHLDKWFVDSMSGGRADKAKPSDFDVKQLLKGMAVEMEHTDDPMKALEITMDHLSESPEYYIALASMETSLEAGEVDGFGIPKEE